MALPVELVQLLQHAGIEGQKLTWDLQVNSNAVSVKLVWIKAGKPVEKTGETTSQAPKKKHLSPSTRRRNAKRIDQWKAKREAVGENTTCIHFMCWCWWSITNIFIRCILWKVIDKCWIVRVD
jgi:hypothetical protein